MQAILSVILSAAIAFGASAGLTGMQTTARSRIKPAARAVTAPADVVAAHPDEDVSWEELEYIHYDPEDFCAMTDELTELAEGQDAQAVIELYDTLYAELAHIDTLCTIAYLHYCADVTDDYWSEENLYCDKLYSKTYNAMLRACRAVTQGPCADAFRTHVGDQAADEFADYNPLLSSELLEQESKLVNEYNRLIAASGDEEYEYKGSVWTLDRISGNAGGRLADTDYDGYLRVYYGLDKAINEKVGPVFTQLVALRAEIAEIEGYDSYADRAYEQSFGRDYTGEDAQVFCDAVKEVAQDYYDDLYYSRLGNRYDYVEPVFNSEELVQILGEYVEKIDPILVEPWEYMTQHGMLDIDAGNARVPGSFTSTLSEYDAPFIFATLDGNCKDLDSLSHEFGHYTDSYLHAKPNLLTSRGNYDLMEIHAAGLEALLSEFYDDIYSANLKAARFCVLDNLISGVMEGCIQDEFQRRVYAQPDMTLEEINRLFAEICTSYGKDCPMDEEYGWMYTSHTFESPMYYISYATSAIAAIQIWNLAQKDFQAGVDAWRAILDYSFYNADYMTVLPACGLRLFTEEGAVAEILAPMLEEMERMDAGNRLWN